MLVNERSGHQNVTHVFTKISCQQLMFPDMSSGDIIQSISQNLARTASISRASKSKIAMNPVEMIDWPTL